MKFLSTRLKTITERKRVTSMKTVLYSRPPHEKEPQLRHPYLKASKIGVKGLSSNTQRNLSPAMLSG